LITFRRISRPALTTPGRKIFSWVRQVLRLRIAAKARRRRARENGAAVPGANVDLFLKGGTKPLLSTKTSSDGLFHFIGIRAGDYDLTVESTGFLKAQLRGLAVEEIAFQTAANAYSVLPGFAETE
jgi:hypothetical protein